MKKAATPSSPVSVLATLLCPLPPGVWSGRAALHGGRAGLWSSCSLKRGSGQASGVP